VNYQRILLLGGSGQLGQALLTLSWPAAVQAPTRAQLPLENTGKLDAYLRWLQPDLILNAAAFTQVDLAEQQPELNWRVNAELPAQLVRYCQSAGCQLVHYSSDYVFDGSGDLPWPETAPPSPLNAYGRAKAAGDQAVMQLGSALLVRTSWVYAAGGNNFMRTILRLGAQRDLLKVVADQIGAPTPAWLIARVTQQLMQHRQSGLFHLSCQGATSWHQYACAIIKLADSAGLPLQLSAAQVMPISTQAYPAAAARPLNSRLDLAKISAVLAEPLPDWQAALALTFQQFLAQQTGDAVSAAPGPAQTQAK
jgi:dTDP-4-dehydrorhamnose reductase